MDSTQMKVRSEDLMTDAPFLCSESEDLEAGLGLPVQFCFLKNNSIVRLCSITCIHGKFYIWISKFL